MENPKRKKTTIEIAMEKARKDENEKQQKAVDSPVVDKMQRSPVIKK